MFKRKKNKKVTEKKAIRLIKKVIEPCCCVNDVKQEYIKSPYN